MRINDHDYETGQDYLNPPTKVKPIWIFVACVLSWAMLIGLCWMILGGK